MDLVYLIRKRCERNFARRIGLHLIENFYEIDRLKYSEEKGTCRIEVIYRDGRKDLILI